MTLQEAADALGVHYMTAYRYVRLGLLPASKSGGKWVVEADAVESFGASTRPVGRGSANWTERLESRMIAGDAAGAWGVVEAAMASGTSASDVYLSLMTPALHSIGSRWEAGEIGVDEEHLATAVALRLIGRLSPRFARRGRSRGRVVLATPAADQHALATAMLADLLRLEGWETYDLGCAVPVDSLVAAVTRAEANAVVLSVTLREAIDDAAAAVAALRRHRPPVAIIVGGSAITDSAVAERCGADEWAASAEDLVAALDRR